MNFDSVVFYNHFNNGDIHVSRGFIKYIMQKLSNTPLKFYYAHRKDSSLLSDIPNLKYDKSFFCHIPNVNNVAMISDKILYINTWYGCENYRFMNSHAISFDTLYLLFEYVCNKYFDFSLSETQPENLFPDINFEMFQIDNIRYFLNKNHGPKIMIANGYSLSGQSENFNIDIITTKLAEKYHGITFILTNRLDSSIVRNNIVYSQDIIRKESGSDLNENAFLSLFCNLTVGRASGVHSFCLNKENLFNKQNTLYSFSNLDYKTSFWLHDKFQDVIKYSTVVKNFDISSSDKAMEIIDNYIQTSIVQG